MRIVAASLWVVLVVVGWACPLMAGCFYSGAPAADQACHRPSDDSQPTPEDCPYQFHATNPAESRFETRSDVFAGYLSCIDWQPSTVFPVSEITPMTRPFVDNDYFRKLTILLV